MEDHVVEYPTIVERVALGTKINITFTISLNGTKDPQTSYQLDMIVTSRTGQTVKTWGTVGGSITKSGSSVNIQDESGFSSVATFKGYLYNTTLKRPVAKIIFKVDQFVKPSA